MSTLSQAAQLPRVTFVRFIAVEDGLNEPQVVRNDQHRQPQAAGRLNAMVLDAPKSWMLRATLIARIFLASTLLLNACTLIFEPGPSRKLISVVELLLGMAIAEGWHLRYTAGLVLVGTLSTSLLPIFLRRATAGSHVLASIALILPSCVLLCFGRNHGTGSSIRESGRLSSLDSSAVSAIFREADVEVTVRLETGFLRSLHQQRCIVTFHHLNGGAHKTGKEVWYASDDR